MARAMSTKQAARRVPILALRRGYEVIVVAAYALQLAVQGTILIMVRRWPKPAL
jgi:hypothetical protein